MKKRRAMRRYIYRTPLSGSMLILLGALAMLVWSVWEAAVRIDAMDGMTKVYFELAKDLNLPLKETFQRIWRNDAARKDWINVFMLGSFGVFSLLTLLFRKRLLPALLIVPACAYIITYHTGGYWIFQTLNLFETIKLVSAGAIIAGEGLNAYAYYARRLEYKKRLKQRQADSLKKRKVTHGTAKTLIPERRTPRDFGM